MISILFLLALVVVEPAPYSCGPFLLQPGTDRMTVVVDHEAAVTTELRYGLLGDDGAQVVAHETAERHHVFALTGLRPGTEYWYEVTTGDTLASGRRTFRTLPERPKSYRIVALGDVRSLPARWHKVSQRVFRDEKDALFVIGTGDYPSDGRNYGMWIRQFFAPARSLLASVPMWPAIGNHEATRRHDDITHVEQSKFFSLFELPGNERWYRVDYHLLTLLVVDSNSSMAPGQEQYAWLRDQLRSERKRYTLVAFHHAPCTSGPHGKVHLDGTPLEGPIDEGRRFMVPLFEMYGVDLVLNGHDHLYERSLKNGITYVVAGGGGAPLYAVDSVPNPHQVLARSTNHYVGLDISALGIGLDAIDSDGQVFDSVYLAPRPQSLELRSAFLERRISAQVTTEARRVEAFLRCQVANPLADALDLKVSLREGSQESAVQSIHLEPGAEQSVRIPLAQHPAEEPSWQRGRIGSLCLTASGQDEALKLAFSNERNVVLRRPVYPWTVIQGAEVDGKAMEFGEIPKLKIGPLNPVVRGVPSYQGETDMAAELRVTQCGERLHLFLEVRDDRVWDNGEAELFVSDSFHLLVTRPPEAEAAADSKAVARFAFGASGRVQSSLPLNGADTIRRKTSLIEGGYSIEASIPFSMLPLVRGTSGVAQTCFEVVLVDKDPGQAVPSLHRLWSKNLLVSDLSSFGILETSPH